MNESCRLLTLPPEIRAQIWEYVSPGRTIHVQNDQPLRYNACCSSTSDGQWAIELNASKTDDRWSKRVHPICPHVMCILVRNRTALTTDLLLTNRQIYRETRDLPFKLNAFAFDETKDLVTFLKRLTMEQARAVERLTLYCADPPGKWHVDAFFDLQQHAEFIRSRLNGLKHLTCITGFVRSKDIYVPDGVRSPEAAADYLKLFGRPHTKLLSATIAGYSQVRVGHEPSETKHDWFEAEELNSWANTLEAELLRSDI